MHEINQKLFERVKMSFKLVFFKYVHLKCSRTLFVLAKLKILLVIILRGDAAIFSLWKYVIIYIYILCLFRYLVSIVYTSAFVCIDGNLNMYNSRKPSWDTALQSAMPSILYVIILHSITEILTDLSKLHFKYSKSN